MKLKRLATVSLALAFVTGVVVLGAGSWIWHEARQSRDEVEALIDVRNGAYRIDVAIRYLNHLRAEPDILRGLVVQATALEAMLEDESHPRVESARLHLDKIQSLAARALTGIRAGQGIENPTLRPLIDQLRIHESGALESLHEIIDDHNREIASIVPRSLALLLVFAAVVVGLGCLVFWIVFFRIRRPLAEFGDFVSRFGEGDSAARITVTGTDELSDAAALFNQALDQREHYQVRLKERIKEQRCLYAVLELTTDDRRPVDRICQEIVELLPDHWLHEGRAMACIEVDGTGYRSPNWMNPASCMSSPVRVKEEEVGQVSVAYDRRMPDQPGGEGPFLAEERALLDSIATHIGRMIHGRKLSESLARTQRLQAVGELTGGVAHDFNNLLTVIQGNAEMLGETLKTRDPDAAELAGMIDSAAHRGAELTQRLLAFARRQALEPRAVEVGAQLEEMQGLLRRTLGADVELEFKTDPDGWPALIDPAQLETAVLNLVVNSRDAMPAGGKLTIETRNVSLGREYVDSAPEVMPGEYVLVAVSDSGCGIPPADRERVFEPFFTTKQKARGTGLGLSMVYGFIKQSHGHITLYSEVGEGTTVKMYLPRAVEREVEKRPKAVQTDIESGDATILLVEDDELVRRYARDLLQSLGYRVMAASNGVEALEVLAGSEHIDLLLTDVVMPGGMSGRDVAEAAESMRAGIGILFMSGYTENAIVHQGRLDPGVRLLSKPFRRRELARKVTEALADSRGEDI